MLEVADKVIDGIKAAREVAKQVKNAELQSQMADLVSATADLKMETADLKAEILSLREENERLKRDLELRQNLEYFHNAYWLRRDDGTFEGPFSPRPWELKDRMVRMKYNQQGHFGELGECCQYYCAETNDHATVPVSFLEEHDVQRAPEQKRPESDTHSDH